MPATPKVVVEPSGHEEMRRVRPASNALVRRLLSSKPATRIGVLHVYRLEPTDPPPNQRLRLLRSADGGAPSAAQLAEAAERGEAVLSSSRRGVLVLYSPCRFSNPGEETGKMAAGLLKSSSKSSRRLGRLARQISHAAENQNSSGVLECVACANAVNSGGPLSKVKVLDFTQFQNGPAATIEMVLFALTVSFGGGSILCF